MLASCQSLVESYKNCIAVAVVTVCHRLVESKSSFKMGKTWIRK